MELTALYARSVDLAAEVVDTVTPAHMDLATPCGDWTLRRLMEHIVGQHQGFAAAARGAGPDLALWADAPVGDDPAGAFRRTAEDLKAAFAEAEAEAADRKLWLPEIRDGGPFPLELAVGFQLVDTLVHAWDVAASLGTPSGLAAAVNGDPALAAALVSASELVPAGPESRGPDRAFRERLPQEDADTPFERALALLGRDPAWKP
ncbi:TIGR03086 family metal-binding protein [Kitasatospora sp. NPDC093558]|uniref:TIGR03086 family metal-binding protein n=1 Tax=Kitasatospora sp. NPDC093558 TaxID=3155201 RepID=UPI00344AC339